jgi:hypothetical protein
VITLRDASAIRLASIDGRRRRRGDKSQRPSRGRPTVKTMAPTLTADPEDDGYLGAAPDGSGTSVGFVAT